jgi:D-alanine-D-alanine ligase
MHVVILANLKQNAPEAPGKPEDFWIELDSEETVENIADALRSAGHRATFLEADATLALKLPTLKPDICFNIAEGHFGESRTAHVPALLEMLRIPYTGSGVFSQACSLHKGLTKEIWLARGLQTTRFQEFRSPEEPLDPALEFPLFVKPVQGGTGMGVSAASIVRSTAELRNQVENILAEYEQPAIVEPYLSGREFTIGVLGNRPQQRALPPVEIELDYLVSDPGVYGSALKTAREKVMQTAAMEPDFLAEVKQMALDAHNALRARDVSRVDFRCDENGRPYLVEINLTPGLVKGFSDLAVAADAVRDYNWLINTILAVACRRQGLEAPAPDLPAF